MQYGELRNLLYLWFHSCYISPFVQEKEKNLLNGNLTVCMSDMRKEKMSLNKNQ